MPIYDQYLIGSNDDYSGSYTDDIVMMFSGSDITHRKFLGSRTGPITGSRFNSFDLSYSDYVGYIYGKTSGKNNQFISINSAEETYYDSLVASPIDYHLENGYKILLNEDYITGSRVLNRPSFESTRSFTLGINVSRWGTIVGDDTYDGKWQHFFPYENKYKNLLRLKKISYFLPKEYSTTKKIYHTEYHEIAYSTISESKSNLFNGIIHFLDYDFDPAGQGSGIAVYEDNIFHLTVADISKSFAVGVSIESESVEKKLSEVDFILWDGDARPASRNIFPKMAPDLKETYKAYFGFSKKNYLTRFVKPNNSKIIRNMPKSIDYPGLKTSHPTYDKGIGDFTILLNYIIPDGWRFGLYSALPTQTKTVFRRDHFGHPRDMLEQRPYTKFFFKSDKKETITESPISVRFISGSDAYVTNSMGYDNNDSGIYHKEYAAGRPFIDRTTY